MKRVDLLLHGVGNVGRMFLDLLERQGPLLAARHDLTIRVVGAVDSGGGIWSMDGLPVADLLAAKRRNGTVAAAAGGEAGLRAVDCLARATRPLVLVEATLVDLNDGGVGLAAVRQALGQGQSVVSANKGPLVLAFADLMRLATQHGGALMYSATVCGGLPIVNLGRYDLAHATVTRLEGILNSTTHHLLTEMAAGRSFEGALAEAQAAGIAEADPTLDVSGWDAANKLIILANSVLRRPTTPADVAVTGIEQVDLAALRAAETRDERLKLVASAEPDGAGGYTLTVAPRALPLAHPLARLTGHQMGVWMQTDINGDLFVSIAEEDPTPTAAAMLRDLVLIHRGARAW